MTPTAGDYTPQASQKKAARMPRELVCAPKERQGVRSIRTRVAR